MSKTSEWPCCSLRCRKNAFFQSNIRWNSCYQKSTSRRHEDASSVLNCQSDLCFGKSVWGSLLESAHPNEKGFYSNGGELLWGPKEIRCEHILGNYKDYKDSIVSSFCEK